MEAGDSADILRGNDDPIPALDDPESELDPHHDLGPSDFGDSLFAAPTTSPLSVSAMGATSEYQGKGGQEQQPWGQVEQAVEAGLDHGDIDLGGIPSFSHDGHSPSPPPSPSEQLHSESLSELQSPGFSLQQNSTTLPTSLDQSSDSEWRMARAGRSGGGGFHDTIASIPLKDVTQASTATAEGEEAQIIAAAKAGAEFGVSNHHRHYSLQALGGDEIARLRSHGVPGYLDHTMVAAFVSVATAHSRQFSLLDPLVPPGDVLSEYRALFRDSRVSDVFLPVYHDEAQPCHWGSILLNKSTKKASYLDSLSATKNHDDAVQTARISLDAFVTNVLGDSPALWAMENQPCAQQPNSYDCGLLTVIYCFSAVFNGGQVPKPKDHVPVAMWRAVLLAVATSQPITDILREVSQNHRAISIVCLLDCGLLTLFATHHLQTQAGIFTISLDGSPREPQSPNDGLAAISSTTSLTAHQILEQQEARRVFKIGYAEYVDKMDKFIHDRYSQQIKRYQEAMDDLVAVHSFLGNSDTRDESCSQLDEEIATLDADLEARDKMDAMLGELHECTQTTALATSLSTTTTEIKVIKEDLNARRNNIADFSRRLAKVDIDGAVNELGKLLAAVRECREEIP